MMSAKLFVPAGTFDHASGGDTLSPMQFGLALMLPAFLTASIVPSLKVDEVSENAFPMDGRSVAQPPMPSATMLPVRNVIADLRLTNMLLPAPKSNSVPEFAAKFFWLLVRVGFALSLLCLGPGKVQLAKARLVSALAPRSSRPGTGEFMFISQNIVLAGRLHPV